MVECYMIHLQWKDILFFNKQLIVLCPWIGNLFLIKNVLKRSMARLGLNVRWCFISIVIWNEIRLRKLKSLYPNLHCEVEIFVCCFIGSWLIMIDYLWDVICCSVCVQYLVSNNVVICHSHWCQATYMPFVSFSCIVVLQYVREFKSERRCGC